MQRETAEFSGEAQNSAGIECSGAFATDWYANPFGKLFVRSRVFSAYAIRVASVCAVSEGTTGDDA